MSTEDRLRRAIEARTSSVEPSQDALGRIADKLIDQGDPMDISSTRTRWILGAAAAVALVMAIVAGLTLPGDGGDRTETEGVADSVTSERDRTTTTAPDGTTQPSGPESTTSTTAESQDPPATGTTQPSGPSEVEQSQMLWPRPWSETRFDTPEAAARSFARYYARFTDPIVGTFRQGDSRSGEVPVQAFANGPETTVLVRQLTGNKWFVVAAHSEDITIGQPGSNPRLNCPLHVSGTALAFEGQVEVRVDTFQEDGDRVQLGRGFVTGSGSPPAGPYEGDISCRLPGASEVVEPFGILAMWEASAEDGRTLGITAIPIAVAAT